MKKHMYLFLFVGLSIAHSSIIQAGLFGKKPPTSESIVPTASAFPSEAGPACSPIDTSLRTALQNKNLNDASECIEKGANPNTQDDGGNTLLHLSALKQNIEDIRSLYNKGYRIDPNITNRDGEAVLHLLARLPYFKWSRTFAASLLRTDDPTRITADHSMLYNGKTLLEIAAEAGNYRMVKCFLKRTPKESDLPKKTYHKGLNKKVIKLLKNHKKIVDEFMARHPHTTSAKPYEKTPSSSPERNGRSMPYSSLTVDTPEDRSDESIIIRDSDLDGEEESDPEEEGHYVNLDEFRIVTS